MVVDFALVWLVLILTDIDAQDQRFPNWVPWHPVQCQGGAASKFSITYAHDYVA